ncbi:conserved hypothetical protein [Histoplasma capsulatum var. duboisii H88]|uniref:Uncharacterized protein n=1 Tax=Ajellomyces capsulatus (strain H88) TaxID=544711 RepID=F0UGS4_AJEC8|nr:conserved hypothetical protein [Histoplasma capsulatum var. duboisii H88]
MRFQACVLMDIGLLCGPVDSSDSESGPATQNQKQDFSQVASSSSTCPSARPADGSESSSGQYHHHTTLFYLQQEEALLDPLCPNIYLHWQGQNSNQYYTDA